MSQAIETYLDRVMLYAKREGQQAQDIRAEQHDHLLSRVAEFEAEGMSREDAIFKAIEGHGHPRTVGYSLRPRFPLIDIRNRGTARGVIAIGPRAMGVFAFGGAAFGVVAVGGFSAGLVSVGGFTAALLFCWGGFGFAPTGLAYAGMAVGLIALGGMAAGIIAKGGLACGIWAEGGITKTLHSLESAPGWAHTIVESISEDTIVWMGTAALVIGFLVVYPLAMWAQWRENRRLASSDPWLME